MIDRCFKSLLEVELYLSVDLSFEAQRLLSNFRCSSHNLMIEKGRHTSTDTHLRYCPICMKENILVIEDEFHFFYECNKYEALRNKYFNRNWLRNRSLNMFYSIMNLRWPTLIFF